MGLHLCWSDARPNGAVLEIVRQFTGSALGFTLSSVGIACTQVALIAAGLVDRLITAYAGESYPAGAPNPLVHDAVASGAVVIENWSQWTIVARLMAGALGVPFMPTRSLLGSGMATELQGAGFALAPNPFGAHEDVAVVAALTPDIAILQGVAADPWGNVVMAAPYGEAHWGALAPKGGVIAWSLAETGTCRLAAATAGWRLDAGGGDDRLVGAPSRGADAGGRAPDRAGRDRRLEPCCLVGQRHPAAGGHRCTAAVRDRHLQLRAAAVRAFRVLEGRGRRRPAGSQRGDETRDFAARFVARNQRMPTQIQAGDYTTVQHFLKAVQKSDSVDGRVVTAAMRDIPIDDFMMHGSKLRADGSVVRDRYVYRVKSPADSKAPWDNYTTIRKIDGASVLPPLDKSGCAIARKP